MQVYNDIRVAPDSATLSHGHGLGRETHRPDAPIQGVPMTPTDSARRSKASAPLSVFCVVNARMKFQSNQYETGTDKAGGMAMLRMSRRADYGRGLEHIIGLLATRSLGPHARGRGQCRSSGGGNALRCIFLWIHPYRWRDL